MPDIGLLFNAPVRVGTADDGRYRISVFRPRDHRPEFVACSIRRRLVGMTDPVLTVPMDRVLIDHTL